MENPETIKNDEGRDKGKIIPWAHPNPEKEKGEISRVLSEFLGEEPNEDNMSRVMGIIDRAPMVELSDDLWESLKNTDSFHNVRPGHLEDVTQIVDEYNMKLPPENRRSVKKLLESFMNGASMEAPIIIKNGEGKLHLLSGNTRLMISRVFSLRPKVVIVEVN